MSFTLMVILNATMVALLLCALAYVCFIPFRLDRAPHTSHFFTRGLKETPDVTAAPPVPALY